MFRKPAKDPLVGIAYYEQSRSSKHKESSNSSTAAAAAAAAAVAAAGSSSTAAPPSQSQNSPKKSSISGSRANLKTPIAVSIKAPPHPLKKPQNFSFDDKVYEPINMASNTSTPVVRTLSEGTPDLTPIESSPNKLLPTPKISKVSPKHEYHKLVGGVDEDSVEDGSADLGGGLKMRWSEVEDIARRRVDPVIQSMNEDVSKNKIEEKKREEKKKDEKKKEYKKKEDKKREVVRKDEKKKEDKASFISRIKSSMKRNSDKEEKREDRERELEENKETSDIYNVSPPAVGASPRLNLKEDAIFIDNPEDPLPQNVFTKESVYGHMKVEPSNGLSEGHVRGIEKKSQYWEGESVKSSSIIKEELIEDENEIHLVPVKKNTDKIVFSESGVREPASNSVAKEVSMTVESSKEAPMKVDKPDESEMKVEKSKEVSMKVEKPSEAPMKVEKPTESSMKVESPKEAPMKVESPKEVPMKVKNPVEAPMKVETPSENSVKVEAPQEVPMKVETPQEVPMKVKKPIETPTDLKQPKNTKVTVPSVIIEPDVDDTDLLELIQQNDLLKQHLESPELNKYSNRKSLVQLQKELYGTESQLLTHDEKELEAQRLSGEITEKHWTELEKRLEGRRKSLVEDRKSIGVSEEVSSKNATVASIAGSNGGLASPSILSTQNPSVRTLVSKEGVISKSNKGEFEERSRKNSIISKIKKIF